MRGLRIVRDHRARVSDKVRAAAARALTDGANELLQKANQTVPKEEGTLEGSGTVDPATSKELIAQVGYGGEASAYAAKQHEDTTLSHDGGRRAKWLEMAAKENGGRIMRALARMMKKAL